MRSAATIRRRFQDLLEAGPIRLSGGFGTELQRRGCDTRLPLWSARALLDDPDAVRTLHADYLRAGAQVLTANTFRVGDREMELSEIAVRLAREAIAEVGLESPVLLAGSVGPVADCYRPDLVPSDAVLRAAHETRVAALQAAGADLVLVETMNAIREAVAALTEAKRGGVPAFVSFVCRPGGRLLSGEPVKDAVAAVEALEPLAILVNCCAPEVATQALAELRAATDRPVGVYANGEGRPGGASGWRFAGGTSDAAYVAKARRWLAMGAALVGGCCGTTPRTIAALRRFLP